MQDETIINQEEEPSKTSLPADLPTDWQADQIVAPTGEEVGLPHQYGYNYLMEQVNAAQEAVNELGSSQEEHMGSHNNPHQVTAQQIGAVPTGGTAGAAEKLSTARTIRTNLASNAGASFDGTKDITPGVTGVLPVASGGTGAATAGGALANLGGFSKTGGTINGNVKITGNVGFTSFNLETLEVNVADHTSCSVNINGRSAFIRNFYQGTFTSTTPVYFRNNPFGGITLIEILVKSATSSVEYFDITFGSETIHAGAGSPGNTINFALFNLFDTNKHAKITNSGEIVIGDTISIKALSGRGSYSMTETILC